MKENVLVTAPIPRLFVSFVIPSVLSMVLVGIQGMVDGIFLGNFEDTNAMASVNIASPFMQLVLGYSFILCTGTLSYLGRALGERDADKAKNIFRTAVAAIVVASTTVLLAGISFSEQIAYFLGTDEVLLAGAGEYIRILAWFAPAISVMLLCGFMCRLIEKPMLYLAATVCGQLCNILLNTVFIWKLRWGVPGAALATGLSYFVGLLIVVRPFISRGTVVIFFEGRFRGKILASVICNGSSEGINYLATALILFNRAFMSASEPDSVAAFTVINYIGNFTTIVMFGISDGIGSIVSCNFGAGKMERVRQTVRVAVIINLLLGIGVLAAMIFFSEKLVGLFASHNPCVMAMAVHGAKIYGIGSPSAGPVWGAGRGSPWRDRR